MKTFYTALSALMLCSCSAMKNSPKYQLGDDYYLYRQRGEQYRKSFVSIEQDGAPTVYDIAINRQVITPVEGRDQFFLKRSFDVDILTAGFKYRPATENLPRQVNTDFNGNVYLGVRFDRFRVASRNTPAGLKKYTGHRGITLGGFCGIGSTAITPWTTNNQTTDEYNALIITRGLSAMIGANSLTVGVGVGWDAITDRDKDIWIYQNRPWFGLTISLNLN